MKLNPLTHIKWIAPVILSVFASWGQAQQAMPALENPIVTWTNHYRSQYGRTPVTLNPTLTQVARQHAYHMAVREEMAHSLDGKTVADRAKRNGYGYQRIGENVAYNVGYAKPAEKFFRDWMYSPSHWKNIQEPYYTEIGVGVYQSRSGKYYACQVLAKPLQAATPFLTSSPQPNWGSYPTSLYSTPQPKVPPLPNPYFPVPGQGRNVEFSPVYEMPQQEFYVHPFPANFGP